MKTASQHANSAAQQLRHGQLPRPSANSNQDPETSTNAARISGSDIDALFDALRSLYANRFTSANGEFDDQGVWFGELQHLTPQAIQRGVMRCRDQMRDAVRQSDTAWPPQAAEFAILCEPLPSDYGLPNEHDAWSEANAAAHAPDRHQWSHVAIRIAANAVPGGFREIHGCTSQSRRAALKKQFVRQYLALVNRVMAGESLQAQMLIESDASKTPASLAERASRERAQRAAAPFEQFNSRDSAIAACRMAIGGRA